jgi:hypothetical protein
MSNLLNSWKEIATYLNRGVRTVQRWERDLGLPVRRPRGHDRSAVIAFAEEIDLWLKRAPERQEAVDFRGPMRQYRERLHQQRDKLQQSVAQLQTTLDRTKMICAGLQEKHANLTKNGSRR